MGYYNNDVEGLYGGNWQNNNVAGENENPNVAGVSNENFRVPFTGFIESREFCRAVRRCLIRDLLVAGAQEQNNNNKRRKHHCDY
ncbi:hypothetical protein [Bacillus sp. B-jedd]|uniref:hypothetical protein n=1 Tax=Bacillus sp. B-jedd TaxID=1476857 RepID=UPI0005155CFF|nr:hypothetical protein [Bacillus sp. B-jedd]CEG25752.1 hypothetical protein BN1002_00569 [Bacillus sp. B-jedd]